MPPPPPGGEGEALGPVVAAIALWGLRRMGRPRAGETHLPGSYFVAVRSTFRPQLAADVKMAFEFEIDDQFFTVEVAGGRCLTKQGGAVHPDVIVKLGVATLNALLTERVSSAQAVTSGRVTWV